MIYGLIKFGDNGGFWRRNGGNHGGNCFEISQEKLKQKDCYVLPDNLDALVSRVLRHNYFQEALDM